MTVDFSLISTRRSPPVPWSSELRFPWDDSDFSDRMLREHLYQGHDLASRRHALIRREVEWIHNELLSERPSRILDLCCGPGLYLERLASNGHTGHGVDFSPSAIKYARSVSSSNGSDCRFDLADVRTIEITPAYDLVMMTYGQFDTFSPSEAKAILHTARAVMSINGRLFLEVHSIDAVRDIGQKEATWKLEKTGLFSSETYLLLSESFWEAGSRIAMERWFVLKPDSQPEQFGITTVGHTREQFETLLREVGFEIDTWYDAWPHQMKAPNGFHILVARPIKT